MTCSVRQFEPRATPPVERPAEWQELRKLGPIVRSDRHGGFWAVTRYDGAARVLRNAEQFTSSRDKDGGGGQSIPPFPWPRNIPGECEGAEHRFFRTQMMPGLSQASVEARRGDIVRVVEAAFEAVDGLAQFDARTRIAGPIPARSMLLFMGLGLDEADWFEQRTREGLAGRINTPEFEELRQRLLAEAKDRRSRPRDDLISQYANLDYEGRPLTEEELLGVLISSFMFGGLVTATEVIAAAIVYLGEHRDTRSELRSEPERTAAFTEDMVRVVTPAPTVARTVKQDTELFGQPVAAGDRVLVMLGSSNYDPTVFPDPERALTTRRPKTHLAFGFGAHTCPGAPLARLEIELTLNELLKRMPDYRVKDLEAYRTGAARTDVGPVTVLPHPAA